MSTHASSVRPRPCPAGSSPYSVIASKSTGSCSAGGSPVVRLIVGLSGSRNTDLRFPFWTGVPERLFVDPLSLVRLDVLFMAVSAVEIGLRKALGFVNTGEVTVLCGGEAIVLRDSARAGGFSESTFVELSLERRRPSNSASR